MNTFRSVMLLGCLAIAPLSAEEAASEPSAATPAQKNVPVVILKLDDLSAKGLKGKTAVRHPWTTIHEYLSGRGLKYSVGVHCETFEIGHQPTIDWIKARTAEGTVEFWCHGFKSARDKIGDPPELEPGEFERGYDEQYATLRKCQDLAIEKLGFPLRAFGPHWSGTNEDTAKALNAIPEFTIWLYASPAQGEASGKYAYPRYLAVEYKTFLPQLDEFKKQWNRNGRMRDAVVLQGHPQAWMWQEGKPRYEEFKKIIDFLVDEGCTFMTPSEYHETRVLKKQETAQEQSR